MAIMALGGSHINQLKKLPRVVAKTGDLEDHLSFHVSFFPATCLRQKKTKKSQQKRNRKSKIRQEQLGISHCHIYWLVENLPLRKI